MIITARQLEDLHKSGGGNGHVTLPYRARLTPLAADFVRARRLVLGYSEVSGPGNGVTQNAGSGATTPLQTAIAVGAASVAVGNFLWWCDGPCGPAKAAIVAEEKQSTLRALDKPSDARHLVSAIKALATEVKSAKAAGGVLLVQNAGLAVIFANRCPSLRAVPGTCLETVEQAVQQAAANVLVIEYPQRTLQQMRNMLSRFLRAPRVRTEELHRQMQELATCG